MKLSSQIKPISYLKAHAAEIVRNLGEQREPLIIAQNGEAKAVIQDIESYEQIQETMALLKILALGHRQIEGGKTQPAADVIKRLRERREIPRHLPGHRQQCLRPADRRRPSGDANPAAAAIAGDGKVVPGSASSSRCNRTKSTTWRPCPTWRSVASLGSARLQL